MSPGLIVSLSPVAPLLVLPGIAQSGPGKRGGGIESVGAQALGLTESRLRC